MEIRKRIRRTRLSVGNYSAVGDVVASGVSLSCICEKLYFGISEFSGRSDGSGRGVLPAHCLRFEATIRPGEIHCRLVYNESCE